MSVFAIILGIIVVAGIGVGIYFLVRNKSSSTPTVGSTDKPTFLQINVGIIENRQ